jgi:TatD DNase family protein
MIDSHAHIHDEKFDADRDEAIRRAFDDGIESIITIGTNEQTTKQAIEVANKYEQVYATVALHPLHLFDAYGDKSMVEEFDYNKYLEFAKDENVVAIGEVGLDYHHFEDDDNVEAIKKLQKEVLGEFVKIAHQVDKPLVIHCWDGYDDLLDLLLSHALQHKQEIGQCGVIHSFIGSWKTAQKFIDLGFKIGLNGIITYSESYDKLIRNIDLGDILIETDCPYLTPAPLDRESRNEPANVKYIAQKIAQVRCIDVEHVVETTTKNTKKLFGI